MDVTVEFSVLITYSSTCLVFSNVLIFYGLKSARRRVSTTPCCVNTAREPQGKVRSYLVAECQVYVEHDNSTLVVDSVVLLNLLANFAQPQVTIDG